MHDFSSTCFPDGTPIPEWFHGSASEEPDIREYSAVELGVRPDRPDLLQTEKIQQAIEAVSKEGGGRLVFPSGVYSSGSLFFRPGVHLHLKKGAVLQGSTEIEDFALLPTRMEGRSVNYFAALINADHCDGFTISGEGVLDGNGLPYWRHFWLRRKFNPDCTNMDEMRPRILYISNSRNVTVRGIGIRNSPFWSTHYYRCGFLTLENLRITAPAEPVGAPSSDAVDLDNCENVRIRSCFFSVNDDAIALKGGKGADADLREENGENCNIVIENCSFGYCHTCLTCGSETIRNRNIVMENCRVDGAGQLFRLKMRPDTPQRNEFIRVSGIRGSCTGEAFCFSSWAQFRETSEVLPSFGEHILLENLDLTCRRVCFLAGEEEFQLNDIRIRDCRFIVSETELPDHKGIRLSDITFS